MGIKNKSMDEESLSITDGHFSEEEMRASAAEAAAELGDLVAGRGLEHILDEPMPGKDEASDHFSRLADEYNFVAASIPEAAATHMHFGKLFLICGMYEQAAVALDRAVALKPHSADARCLYGRALASLNRVAEAREQYQRACALDPRLVEARFDLEVLTIRGEARASSADEAALN